MTLQRNKDANKVKVNNEMRNKYQEIRMNGR